MGCSLCGESGHNKRTCSTRVLSNENASFKCNKDSNLSKVTDNISPKNCLKEKKSTLDTTPTNPSSRGQERTPQKILHDNGTKGAKHASQQLKDAQKVLLKIFSNLELDGLKVGAGAAALNLLADAEVSPASNKIKGNGKHAERELDKAKLKETLKNAETGKVGVEVSNPDPDFRKKEHVNFFCDGCQSHKPCGKRHDRYDKTCSTCNKSGHNSKTCPSVKREIGPTWMRPEARERLLKGPSDKDGAGYLYMYTLQFPQNSNDRQLFKIGMSEFAPEGRRIKAQQWRNNEQYRVIFSQQVKWRMLTERLVHLQLTAFRHIREDVEDGKTEWFKSADQNHLLVVIRRVIKYVDILSYESPVSVRA